MLERIKVPKIKVPTWPELSVAKMLPVIVADRHFKPYFADSYPKGKVPYREYFCGVVAAIKPGFFKCLIDDALR